MCGLVRLGIVPVKNFVQYFTACLVAVSASATDDVYLRGVVLYRLLVSSNLCHVWLASQGRKDRLAPGGGHISTIAECNNLSVSCLSSPTPMYPPTYLEPGIG